MCGDLMEFSATGEVPESKLTGIVQEASNIPLC